MTEYGAALSPIGSSAIEGRRRRAARSADYREEQARLAPYHALAQLIIGKRIQLGLTQEQLAHRMATSVSAVSRLESGQHRPNIQTLERVGRAFGERPIFGFEDAVGRREVVVVGCEG